MVNFVFLLACSFSPFDTNGGQGRDIGQARVVQHHHAIICSANDIRTNCSEKRGEIQFQVVQVLLMDYCLDWYYLRYSKLPVLYPKFLDTRLENVNGDDTAHFTTIRSRLRDTRIENPHHRSNEPKHQSTKEE
jgi:hypothetical protein